MVCRLVFRQPEMGKIMEKQIFHFYIASIREIFVSSGILFLFSLLIFPILDFFATLLLNALLQGDITMWTRVWYSPKTVVFWFGLLLAMAWLVCFVAYLAMFWGWCYGIFKRSWVCLDDWGVHYDTYPTGKGDIPYSSIRTIELDYKENPKTGVVGYGKITIHYYSDEHRQQMSRAILNVNLLKYKWTWDGSGGGYLQALLTLDSSIRERTATWRKTKNTRHC